MTYFEIEKKFEAYVIEVTDDSLFARIVDEDQPDETIQAEIPLKHVRLCERDMVIPGAGFFWRLGFLKNEYGLKRPESQIRFKPVIPWTPEQIEAGKRWGDKVWEAIEKSVVNDQRRIGNE